MRRYRGSSKAAKEAFLLHCIGMQRIPRLRPDPYILEKNYRDVYPLIKTAIGIFISSRGHVKMNNNCQSSTIHNNVFVPLVLLAIAFPLWVDRRMWNPKRKSRGNTTRHTSVPSLALCWTEDNVKVQCPSQIPTMSYSWNSEFYRQSSKTVKLCH